MDELLYERVAAHVEALIARGTLRGGARAPSVRKLARQQRCSVATAVLAYRTLEAKGVLEARPQSGHYVRIAARPPLPEPRATRTLAAPAAPAVSSLVAKVYGAARDPKVVNFGTAVPAAALLPVERLGRIVARLARTELAQHIHYDVPPGNVHLRRQIARRSVEWGCALGEDDFVTTVGAMEALHLALRAVTQPGDVIAVESPTYYGLLQLIESLGLRVVEIPAHPGAGLDLAALEEALAQHRVRAVLAMPNFNNPLGSLMPEANKKELVEMLARREIPLIEDDLYGDLHHQGERPRSAKAFDRDGNVLLCGSVSKTIAPGFRVGWIAPGRHRDRVEALKFAQSVGTPPLLQVAVAELMEAGGYDRHLRGMRAALAAQVQHTRRHRRPVPAWHPRVATAGGLRAVGGAAPRRARARRAPARPRGAHQRRARPDLLRTGEILGVSAPLLRPPVDPRARGRRPHPRTDRRGARCASSRPDGLRCRGIAPRRSTRATLVGPWTSA